ncbi:hypothetical protein GAPWKB11_1686 [Gilliamella apicola]|nr:hypothetical protein GAPWKB11_1686 [Gilliamella apicola]
MVKEGNTMPMALLLALGSISGALLGIYPSLSIAAEICN